jgi:hypothetical protein
MGNGFEIKAYQAGETGVLEDGDGRRNRNQSGRQRFRGFEIIDIFRGSKI